MVANVTPKEWRHDVKIGGKTRRWMEGRILYAENDFVRAAYVVTRDRRKVGCIGWYGKQPVLVEFIRPEDTTAWDSALSKLRGR